MKPSLTFTLDLEDHAPAEFSTKRYLYITEKILEFLKERQIRATVFTVGKLAEESPDLVKDIHAAGHEIAHHSYDHTILTQQSPEEFKAHTKKAKDILEDITGDAVVGYRAPVFSLTQKSLWAADILKELGFEYSSSVLPAKNPLHGLSNAPDRVFKWSNGLVEIPAPVSDFGPARLPFLGGFYLRYLPFGLINGALSKTNEDQKLWTYCHPYDFDHEEKNWRIAEASLPVSMLLWFNRKNSFKKLDKLIDACEITVPFKEQDFANDLPVFDPTT